ncbi:hypothetical protein M9435_002769 [Picochlorum sp. BPE23]|nr:hypothetical protein M9435_002769 [Picochlorum sp. BPE23]
MNREGILGAEGGGTPGFLSDVENTSPFASEQHSLGEEVLEADHFDLFSTLLDIREAKNVMKDVHLGPLLGNGSYGNVYLGYHELFGKVAVKVIPIQSCAKLREFDMEVKTGLDIKNRNVTALHEWRVVQTKYYISSAVSDDDGPCPTHVSSPFCQKASSDGSPNAVYQRLQSMRHRLYSSNCSAGFSRMSSSNSIGSNPSSTQGSPVKEMQASNGHTEEGNGCHCTICSSEWIELWLIQELCCLGTLSKAIEKGSFTEIGKDASKKLRFVTKIALDIARGIAALHERDVIHGDLSSNNVMLARDDDDEVEDEVCLKPWTLDASDPLFMPVAKLIDFGRSKSTARCTQHTDSLSTLAYMSPEMLSNGTITPAADTYSFGVLLWELWMNALAWDGLLAAQIIVQRSMGKVLDIPEDTPPELEHLMRDCLAEDRHMRPLIGEIISRLISMQP